MHKRYSVVQLGMVSAVLLLSACQNQSAISENTSEALQNTTTIVETNTGTDPSSGTSKAPETQTQENTASDQNGERYFESSGLTFSLSGGCYKEPVDLVLTASGSGEIYYTLDGSDPEDSPSRILYTAPIHLEDVSGRENVVSAVDPQLFDTAHCHYERSTKSLVTDAVIPASDAVDKCNVVKAVYIDERGNSYMAASQTYFIGEMADHITGLKESCEASGTSLAVISITMDFDDLFDAEKGIYVKGDIFEKSFAEYLEEGGKKSDDCGRKLAANYSQRGRAWEREAYIDFYEADPENAENVLSQGCGIRIQGNYSRSDLQKGFRLYARSDYGDKRFRYAVFGNQNVDDNGDVIDTFKTLVLRNGGNCAFTSKFNDTYWQSLIKDLHVETQNSRPAVVYLNGEYWGLYVLEEDYSQEYFDDTHGVDRDQVVLYKGDAETYVSGYKLDLGEIPEGEDENYYFSDLLDFFRKHSDLRSEEDYKEFCTLVDPDSVKDYFAVEVWINNKWDWPGKNWSMWKTLTTASDNPYADGRWRFCIYDVEFGGVSGAGDAYTNTIKEDNYKTYGLLDMDTDNPAVLCFAYLMTNENFRQDFYKTLNELSENQFAYDKADQALKMFEDTYGPLMDQFFARYPGTGSKEEALNGGYASAACIRDFLKLRADHIQPMIDYAERIENK